MSGPTRLRFVDELVGAFVLGCLLLFVAGLVLAGRAHGWFEQELVLTTVFPAKGALDLHRDAEVRIQGALAGRVGDIVPNEWGELETEYHIRGRFRDLVRTNSVAVIKKKFKIAGDAFVEITTGDRRFPVLENGAAIVSLEDEQLIEMVTEAVEEVRRTVVPMLEEVQDILANANGLLVAVQEGKGLVGTLLHDETLSARLNAISADLEKASPGIPRAADDLQAVAARITALADEMSTLAKATTRKVEESDLQPALRETEGALRETRRVMESLQRHWLLRRYAPDPDASYDVLAPSQIPLGKERP